MSRIYSQKMPAVLASTASLAGSGSISGSLISDGYAFLIGGVRSSASGIAASSLIIEQSYDQGSNWDHVSACDAISENTSASGKYDVFGNAIRVTYRNGTTNASSVRIRFMLRPI